MKNVLLERHRPDLQRLARAHALLAFDYDGVLAPLVSDPEGAPMRRTTRQLLARLASRWPCAVVSGRAFAHTLRLTQGLVPLVVGNHGYEIGHARPVPRSVLTLVRGWRRALERELAGMPGIFFEDKRSTLSIHYGLQRGWHVAETAVQRAVRLLDGARLVQGKKVLNIIPAGFPHKGDALRELLRRLHLETALYAGDDVTDEDAFALGPPLVLGVRVGPGPSRAPYRLASQDRIEELLEILLRLRLRAQ
ncbi:MAG: trehalose-phosphatase [Anaeromyxobacter sp. RBG_16_69_14]|nr:MAG: trehalose-phosphatase [Anaeromyxobacter sp. RBG_16_69_14]